MKAHLFKLFFFGYLSIFFFGSCTQSVGSTKELILQTTELKPYFVSRISLQLSALDGVQLRGYHSCTQTLLITYDDDKVADTTIIISIIEHLNSGTCVLDAFFENLYAFIDRAEKYN